MQCVTAKGHTPFPLPVCFLCGGGMELLIDMWCFHVQTWTLGLGLVWKQVLPLHLLYFSHFQCHCFGAAPRVFVSAMWPFPLSAYLGQGCSLNEIWLDLWFITFHFLELLLCLLVTGRICSFQILSVASCKCKVTSAALVFFQLHYCLESILK